LTGTTPTNRETALRDGEPEEPEVMLSPLRYLYEHQAELGVIVQGNPPAPDRKATYP